MRAVIQRVTKATLSIQQQQHAAIGQGLVVLLGVGRQDTTADAEWLATKIRNLRIFSDAGGRMNYSVLDVSGAILLVSQFTLFAQTRKGNRPSFVNAAGAEQAQRLYQTMEAELRKPDDGLLVKTGVFGADMQIQLINDGPVTLVMDSRVDF